MSHITDIALLRLLLGISDPESSARGLEGVGGIMGMGQSRRGGGMSVMGGGRMGRGIVGGGNKSTGVEG